MLKPHQLPGLLETFEVALGNQPRANVLQVPPGLDLCVPGGRKGAGGLSGDMHVVKGTSQAVLLICSRCGNYTEEQPEYWVHPQHSSQVALARTPLLLGSRLGAFAFPPLMLCI